MEAIDFLEGIFAQADPALLGWLLVFGVAAYIFSTLAGGGGALLLVPLVNYLLGVRHTAPVINLGNLIGRPSRLVLFWKYIRWKVCLYYAVPAVIGAAVGTWVFGAFRLEGLQLLVGLFLVSTLFQFRFGKKERSFEMRYWYFAPLGFLVALLGTLIGAMGPVLNPFYMNAGLEKEELIATKTANSFFMGLSQIGGYTFFGLLEGPYWAYGIALGVGALIGNVIGKKVLKRLSVASFRKILIAFMVLSGGMMIYQALSGVLS